MLIAAELNSSYRRTEITAVLSSLSAKAAGMLGLFSAGIKNAAPSYNVVVDQCQRVEAALEMGWTASDGTRCDMQWFITSLIEASVPREVAKAVAAIAIDATAAATWAATRQYAVESEARAARDAHDHEVDGEYQGVEIADNGRVPRGADLDARSIHKSATNRQPARILVGYYHNLGAITRELTYRGNPDCIEIGDKQPGFIVSYNVSTDQDPSHGIDLYDDAADLAGNNLQVQADQGYTRYNRDFLAPLRKRGAEPFIGLPVTAKRYPKKVYLGKKEREFWQYCGALYPPWISEERLLPPDNASEEELQAHFAGLSNLAWSRHNSLTGGRTQIKCPQCSGHITSDRKTRRENVKPKISAEYVEPETATGEDGEPLHCCESRTITISAEEAGKHQLVPFGTKASKIALSYRNRVEGAFSEIENCGGFIPGWCRIFRLPAQQIGGLMLVLAHNRRVRLRERDKRAKAASRHRNSEETPGSETAADPETNESTKPARAPPQTS